MRPVLLAALDHGPATLRIHALRAIPRPLPDEFVTPVLQALDDPDWGVLREACDAAGRSAGPVFARPLVQVVGTIHANFTQATAHHAALACRAGPRPCTAVLTTEDRVAAAERLMRGTIDLPFGNGSGGNSSLTREQRFRLRDAWRDFLREHHATLAAGRRVPPNEPRVVAALTGLDLRPGEPVVSIDLADGTRWPPTP